MGTCCVGSMERCRTIATGRSGVALGSRSGLGGVRGPTQEPVVLLPLTVTADPSRVIAPAGVSNGAPLAPVGWVLRVASLRGREAPPPAMAIRASLSASRGVTGMRAMPPGFCLPAWPGECWLSHAAGLLMVFRAPPRAPQSCVSPEKSGADDVSSRAGAPRCTHACCTACAAVSLDPGAGARSLRTRSFASPEISRQNPLLNSLSSRAGAELRAATALAPNSPSNRWYP